MAPKRTSKQSGHLTQPTLSFQTRRPTTGTAKAVNKNLVAPTSRRADSASSISSVERAATPPAAHKKKRKVEDKAKEIEVVTVDERESLDPNSNEWDGVYCSARAEMGNAEPIHAGPDTSKVTHILRVFDMTSKYGPCAGMTRLQRWERAKKWGLNPPEEIKEILLTKQGEDDPALRESVLNGWV